MFAEIDDATGIAWCSNHLGDNAAAQGDVAGARRLYEAGADVFRKMDNRWGLARSACDLGHLACEEGSYELARAFFHEALIAFRDLEHKRGMASALEGLARLAHQEGESRPCIHHRRRLRQHSDTQRARWFGPSRTGSWSTCLIELPRTAIPRARSKHGGKVGRMSADEAIRYAIMGSKAEMPAPESLPDRQGDAPLRSDRQAAPTIRPCSRMSVSSGEK